MSEYDNNLTGALFKNKQQREGKKDANYRGNCEINGVEFYIDAWINDAKSGEKYMKLRFKPKDVQPAAAPAAAPAEPAAFDDDIPF